MADFQKLERNLTDMVFEEQVKLGYCRETVRLYYPLESLNRLLGTACDERQLYPVLAQFQQAVEDRLGKVEISNQGSRFCIAIPEEGAAYVHEHSDKNDFLVRFIAVIAKHGSTLDDILNVFYDSTPSRENVAAEKLSGMEFDYLVYFKDGIPSDYCYCLTLEGCHMTYHRFTRDDYEQMFFRDNES